MVNDNGTGYRNDLAEACEACKKSYSSAGKAVMLTEFLPKALAVNILDTYDIDISSIISMINGTKEDFECLLINGPRNKAANTARVDAARKCESHYCDRGIIVGLVRDYMDKMPEHL